MAALKISNTVTLDENEIEITAIRVQGSGGQKVNKVSAAIHLRFDISASSLPEFYNEQLLLLKDKRITKDGMVGNLTDSQQQIITAIKHTPKISAVKLSEIVGISKRKIEENVAKLKKLGLIDRVGGTRGHWEVKV